MRAEVCIYGEPQGKGRPKFSTVCGHPKARTPEKTVIYENLVQTEYRHQSGLRFPDDAMLDVRVFAYYAIPKSISKKKRQAMLDKKIRPTKKPDADNVCKVIIAVCKTPELADDRCTAENRKCRGLNATFEEWTVEEM